MPKILQTSETETPLPKRRVGALLLVLLAATVWGGLLWNQWRTAPLRGHLEAGVQQLQKGNGFGAEQEWRAALSLDPHNAQAWEFLGDYYQTAGRYAEAKNAFEKLHEVAPHQEDVLARLAQSALQSGDAQAAEKYISEAIKANPNDEKALRVAIEVALRLKQRDVYLQRVEKLTELKPQEESVLIMLANELAARNEFDKTLPLAERILKLNAVSTNALFLRGYSLVRKDPTLPNLRRAEADFHKVLELDPSDHQAHRELGRLYLRLRQPRKAVEHFEAVGRGRPYASAHFLELSNAYRRAGNAPQAEALRRRFFALKEINTRLVALDEKIDNSPNEAGLYLEIAALLLSGVKNDDFYALYRYRIEQEILLPLHYYIKQAQSLRPNDARVRTLAQQFENDYDRYLQQGLALLRRRDIEGARAKLQRAEVLRDSDARLKTALQQLEAMAP
jgi:Flp pilus assembly protein TadD